MSVSGVDGAVNILDFGARTRTQRNQANDKWEAFTVTIALARCEMRLDVEVYEDAQCGLERCAPSRRLPHLAIIVANYKCFPVTPVARLSNLSISGSKIKWRRRTRSSFAIAIADWDQDTDKYTLQRCARG